VTVEVGEREEVRPHESSFYLDMSNVRTCAEVNDARLWHPLLRINRVKARAQTADRTTADELIALERGHANRGDAASSSLSALLLVAPVFVGPHIAAGLGSLDPPTRFAWLGDISSIRRLIGKPGDGVVVSPSRRHIAIGLYGDTSICSF